MSKRDFRDFSIFCSAVFVSCIAFGVGLATWSHGAVGMFPTIYGLAGLLTMGIATYVAKRRAHRRRYPVQAIRRRRPVRPMNHRRSMRVLDGRELFAVGSTHARMSHGVDLEQCARRDFRPDLTSSDSADPNWTGS